jgi:Cu(I)/Ag(I) efflux system membrane fusion protein
VLALGGGKFRVHEVLTGLESGEYIEVLAGLSEGDRIVASAQFLLDSESSIAGSVRRLDANAGPDKMHGMQGHQHD